MKCLSCAEENSAEFSICSYRSRGRATIAGVPVYVYILLAAGWLLWFAPFLLNKRTAERAKEMDRRARWGMVIQAVAYVMLWQRSFWKESPSHWRVALSAALFLCAILLSWTATRALGRHWRLDAALNPTHELVISGPYKIVRHPIYTSMLCVLLATAILVTPYWLLLPALVVFLIGTEIRVRIEDRMLNSRFGVRFQDYRRRVAAYVPYLR